MLLRRLIQHVEETNWFLVTLDLLVVLLGLWGAFELENWNAERRERKVELDLVSQLHDEIVLEAPGLERQLEFRREVWSLAAEVAQILNQPGEIEPLSEAQCRSMLRISILSRMPLKLLSLREMVSSGYLSTMRDRALKQALLRLNDVEENALSQIDLVRPMHWVLVDRYPELLPRSLDASHDTSRIMACDAGGMRDSRAFRNHLISDLGRYGGVIDSEGDLVEALQEVHRRLDERLSIDHSGG